MSRLGRAPFTGNYSTLILSVTCICLLLSLSCPSRGNSAEIPKVLIIHSYHQEYSWTDHITEGIESAFTKANVNAELYVEYMDTKRHNPADAIPLLRKLFELKYKGMQLDLIMLSDNNALNFILSHGEDIFDGVPVVFCGINNFRDSMIEDRVNITGIVEDIDIEKTIDLALKIHPGTKTIAVINDSTPTGMQNQERLEQEIQPFKDKVAFLYLIDLAIDELLERVHDLPTDTIVLLFTFHRDRSGKVFSVEEFVPMITGVANVPVYALWETYVGYGIFGGIVANGRTQGRMAAEQGLRILNGEPVEDIPVIQHIPNQPMFDYVQLKRFGVNPSVLPENSVIINSPASFYKEHRNYVLLFIISVSGLFAVIVVLTTNIRRRMRAEEELKTAYDQMEHKVSERTSELEEANSALVNEINDRKKVEEALSKSRAQLRAVIDNIPSDIFGINPEGHYFIQNNSLRNNWGDIIGKRPEDFAPDRETLTVWEENNKRAFAGETVAGETSFTTQSGESRIYHNIISPIYEDDHIEGIVGINIDITDLKNAETQIINSARDWSDTFDSITDLVSIHDRNFRIIRANKACSRFAGLSPEELVGRSCYEIFHCTHSPVAECPLVKSAELKHPYTMEMYEPSLNMYLMITVSPIYEDGGIKSYVHYAKDITDRKKVEADLKESEEKFRSLFNQASDSIFLLSPAGQDLIIVDMNDAALTTHGYSREEMTGQSIGFLDDPDTRVHVNERAAVLSSGMHLQFEGTHRRKDGSTFLVEVSARLINIGNTPYILAIDRDITARKKAEQALKISEEKYREVVEGTGDLITRVDPEGKFLYVNHMAEHILGASPEECIGRSAFDFIHPDDRLKTEEWFRDCCSKKLSQSPFENRQVNKETGRIYSIMWTSNFYYDSRGEIVAANGIGRDVTEQREAQETIRRQYEMLQNVIESLTHPFYVINIDDYSIALANSASGPQYIPGTVTCYSLTHHGSRPCSGTEHPCPVEKIKTTGEAVVVEHIHFDQAGNEKIFEVHGYPLFGNDGRLQQVIEYNLDITTRKHSESLLRESEERYRNSFRNSHAVMLLIDPDSGHIIDANPAALEFYGYSPAELAKLSITDISTRPAQKIFEELEKARKEERKDFILKHRLANGEIRDVEVFIGPVQMKGRTVLFSIVHDVTRRMRAERDRERLNRELENKNREMEEILRVTSHDLRSPLVNLQGFTNELEDSLKIIKSSVAGIKLPVSMKNAVAPIFAHDIPEALKYIKLSISKMDTLVHGLSQLSRTDRATLTITEIDMNRLLKDILSSFDFQCKERGIVITLSELPSCSGDELMVNQLFSNLIGNSIKYLDPGRPGVIKISGQQDDGYSVYCVEDNGIGIAGVHQDKIFEIFYQLNPHVEGEGLGLAIVRKIVERHKGEIWLESEPGAGTSVYVRMPSKAGH